MSVLKPENKVKKMEQRIKSYEGTNPKLAEKLRGKLFGFKGKK